MGCISSPSCKIDNMLFNPMPTYKVIHGKIIALNHGMIVLGDKGAIYTNIEPLRRKVHCSGIRSWSEDLFESLKMFGLISKEDEKIHGEYLKRLSEQNKTIRYLHEVSHQKDNPAIKVDIKVWKELWNKLDYFAQMRNKDCKPPHARIKPRPQI